jgi:hypothetical protein
MLLDNYQVIKENGNELFAVIDFNEFKQAKEIISNTEKLQDYLDYLHIQDLKKQEEKVYSLNVAMSELGI